MAGTVGAQPREVQRLIDEVWLLHVRLHRVTVALALTEELLAETFEKMADDKSEQRGSEYLLHAKRARVAAEECRAFAARVDTLGPAGRSMIDLNSSRDDRSLY